jgi:chromosome segregation ATPase
VLTGAAREAQLTEERLAADVRHLDIERRRQSLARRTAQVEHQILALQDALAIEQAELESFAEQDVLTEENLGLTRAAMAAHRWADPADRTTDPVGPPR